MKTILVTTCWLGNQEYIDKTKKFLKYYSHPISLQYDNVVLLDNASEFNKIFNLTPSQHPYVQRFHKHLPRTSILGYPYLWRAVYFFQELFKEYDKIVYMDNDFFLTSEKAISLVNNFNSGYMSFYCNKHKFPETGIQVVTKDCKEYWNFVKDLSEEEFIAKYTGKMMETHLPLTHIEKDLIGDRWSEYGIIKQDPKWDWSAQTLLKTIIK